MLQEPLLVAAAEMWSNLSWGHHTLSLETRASNEGSQRFLEDFTITEKAPTRAFSWLKAATTAFTFKTLCRCKGRKRHIGFSIVSLSQLSVMIFTPVSQFHIYLNQGPSPWLWNPREPSFEALPYTAPPSNSARHKIQIWQQQIVDSSRYMQISTCGPG